MRLVSMANGICKTYPRPIPAQPGPTRPNPQGLSSNVRTVLEQLG